MMFFACSSASYLMCLSTKYGVVFRICISNEFYISTEYDVLNPWHALKLLFT